MHEDLQDITEEFVIWLRQEYANAADPYNPTVLWKMFTLYYTFLRQTADKQLTTSSAKQIEAYKLAVTKPECAIWRTRRGGKTIMMTVLEVFWSILNFGDAYSGKVVHRTPHTDQLKMYHIWMRLNPFVTKINNQSHEISIIASETIWSGCTSYSNSDGYGCSVLYEDEWGKTDLDKIIYEYLQSTRLFIVEGCVEGKRHLHASTAQYGSVFAQDMEFLEDEDPLLVHRMPWTDCPWLSKETIEKERRKHFANNSFIAEEFNCELVPKGGLFFFPRNWAIMGVDPNWPIVMKQITHGGLDFNGAKTGHIMVEGHWDEENKIVYILKETRFDTTQSIADYFAMNAYISYEVEGMPKRDGFNAGFAQHLLEIEARCLYQAWDKTQKGRRLVTMQNSMLVVHPSCKWVIKNLREAICDPKSLKVELLKKNNQHGIDAVMHMLHAGGSMLDIANPQHVSPSQRQFDDVLQMMQYKR